MKHPVSEHALLTPPGHGEYFDRWLHMRGQADRRDRLSVAASKPYRYIWNAWARWLTAPSGGLAACPWFEASPAHVWTYLEHGPSPSTQRGDRKTISEISRRRYWRVLDMLYESALAQGLIPSNPARHMLEPRPEPERPEGQVFNSMQWQAIQSAFPTQDSLWDVRDRAILHLLMDAGLTTGEVCTLQMHQVSDQLKQVGLRIDGRRAAQERALQLEQPASMAIKKWMAARRKMPNSDGSQFTVFLTQRGRAMSPRAVFHLASTTIQRGFNQQSLKLPNHIGAMAMRNTRMVMWMNAGVPPEEVVRRAGLKHTRAFQRLVQHIKDDVLEQLKL